MKPAPIPERILAALKLQPMTARQLARCLSLSDQSQAHHTLSELCRDGMVRRHGSARTVNRRWAFLFELTTRAY